MSERELYFMVLLFFQTYRSRESFEREFGHHRLPVNVALFILGSHARAIVRGDNFNAYLNYFEALLGLS